MTVPTPATPPRLVVSVEDVAAKLRLPVPLSDVDAASVRDAILDAMADAESIINRPLFAREETLEGVSPVYGQPLTSYKAWPVQHFDDWVTIVSATPVAGEEGRYDLELLVGLDGPNEPTLTRWVRAHAAESLRNDPDARLGRREVRNVAADGQSVTYAGRGSAEAGAVGSLPNKRSLDRLKRVSVSKRNRWPEAPWPYNDDRYSSGRRY